jgi:hypothetical protein
VGQCLLTVISKVGSRATQTCEPRQVRKEATVSRLLWVPWERLTGVAVSDKLDVVAVEGRCAVSILLSQRTS